MNHLERSVVKVVAQLAPWLAPLPSAYFVARSAMVHLALPLPVAAVVAAIIETLGLATIHTALWAYDWNIHKRKSDPSAPVMLPVALGGVYVLATLGLVVFLEVWPILATYAPAIFPALAVVGALNLALVSLQEQREAIVEKKKAEARQQRRKSRNRPKAGPADSRGQSETTPLDVQHMVQNGVLDTVNRTRRERKAANLDIMVDIYMDDPGMGATDMARCLGIGRSTVYNYLADLETAGRINRDNGVVKVLGPASRK